MRTHSTPAMSAGLVGESMPGHSSSQIRAQGTTSTAPSTATDVPEDSEAGEYWLPWHIDSNFVTVLHKEMYAREADASLVAEPEGAGILMMNKIGETVKFKSSDEDALVLQMGAFGQIYSGGQLSACRHAVLTPRPPGIARFNYCNFWYVPWDTVCDTPVGMEQTAVNTGWNAMMDHSYLNITMKQSFSAFRQFMTSPEARIQFVDTVRFKELSEMLPISLNATSPTSEPFIQVDVLTDVRCPFSLLSQTNLEAAAKNLGMESHVNLKFHPVFLNPNVPKEGESLDDYLWREYGYTKEFAHSEDYPLRKAGLEAGIELNPHRRVVNTFDAFCLMEVAQEEEKQQQLVQILSRRYFEQAEDISDEDVLSAAAAEVGLAKDAVLRMRSAEIQQRVQVRYGELAEKLSEVPHFLLRETVSGQGLEVGGFRSVADWEEVLQRVIDKRSHVGMSVAGPYGKTLRLEEANPHAPVSLALSAQHGWTPSGWPYEEHDFSRMDESSDCEMYKEPRLVEHLDEDSLKRLSTGYQAIFDCLPDGFSILDLCSSWNSHFNDVSRASRVVVHGLNALELEANKQATERHVQDLNANASLPWETNSFDVLTLALSIQYLTDPKAVFAEINRVLKPGGMAVVAFSHRTFIEKAINIWARQTDDGEGHAHLICNYFQHGPHGGWEKLATVDLSPRHADPVWLVTAVKCSEQS
mmetsp:Transcript_58598/g.104205  ORF Transcript_58598/g.104205 Transcript_58598/m.104205 type:complete len:697 (-) Transcript_58598:87-2177(-)